MSSQPNCSFYYGDYFRGRFREACRLFEQSGQSASWNRSLCDSCPIPGIMRETTCRSLALDVQVVRRFGLFPRVEPFAVCTKQMEQLENPGCCPTCEAEG